MLPYLILIDDPGLSLFIVCFVAIALLGDLVDGEMLQPKLLRQLLAMHRFPHTGGTSDDHIGRGSHPLRVSRNEGVLEENGNATNLIPQMK